MVRQLDERAAAPIVAPDRPAAADRRRQARAPRADAAGGPPAERRRQLPRPRSTTCSRERDRLRLPDRAGGRDAWPRSTWSCKELTAADGSCSQARLTAAARPGRDQRQERDQLRAELRRRPAARLSELHARKQRPGQPHRGARRPGAQPRRAGHRRPRGASRCSQQPAPGPWRTVLGMIADFLTVGPRVRAARSTWPSATGRSASWSATPALLAEALAQRSQPFSGRVSFLPLATADATANRSTAVSRSAVRAARSRRIVASPCDLVVLRPSRAGRSAGAAPGRHLIVRDLATARAHRRRHAGLPLRHAAGRAARSRRHADGRHAPRRGRHPVAQERAARAARAGSAARQSDRRDRSSEPAELRDRLAGLDRDSASAAARDRRAAEQAADLRDAHRPASRAPRRALHEEVDAEPRRDERHRPGDRRAGAGLAAGQGASRGDAAARGRRAGPRCDQADQEHARHAKSCARSSSRRCTAAQVTLAQMEERLRCPAGTAPAGSTPTWPSAARSKQQRPAASRPRQAAAAGEPADHAAGLRRARPGGTSTRKRPSGASPSWSASATSSRQERQPLAEQAPDRPQSDWRAQQEQAHARELAVNDLRHRRDTLADRLREDYQLDLAELYQAAASRPSRNGSRAGPRCSGIGRRGDRRSCAAS